MWHGTVGYRGAGGARVGRGEGERGHRLSHGVIDT